MFFGNTKLGKPVKNFVLRNPNLARRYYQYYGIDYFSVHGFDRLLEPFIKPKNGFYVELGADNGIYESTSRYFEVFRGYTGILIEPHPENFSLLKKVRSKKNHFVNAACVNFGFPSPNTKLLLAGAMSVVFDLESDLPDKLMHISKGAKHLAKMQHSAVSKVMWHEVPARTLNSILEEALAPHVINFLSLDVEGAESAVIKGIDHQKYRFKLIIIESRNHLKTKLLLEGFGYEFIKAVSPSDLLFKDVTISNYSNLEEE